MAKHVFIIGFFLWFSAACSPIPSYPTSTQFSSTTPKPEKQHLDLLTTPTFSLDAPTKSYTSVIQPTKTKTIEPPTPTLTAQPDITLIFTGQIVPARCVQAGVDANNGADYIYAAVADYLRNADLTIGTLNATLSDYPPTTGCVETFVLVGRPTNADAMARAGFDIMSVATNHIKNCGLTTCGDRAFFDTLYHLNRVGIIPVGAGNNLSDALKPVIKDIKGVKFAFVSQGQIEQNAFASENTPGIAVLDPINLEEAIKSVKATVDVVIAMPHWGPEYSVMPNPSQQNLAKLAVEAGADLIVGNHTHVIQAITEIEKVPVFYGLGNFVFDQTWDRQNQQSLIIKVRFSGDKYTGYEVLPVWADMEGRVFIANPDEAQQILSRVQTASQNLPK